jgi:molybdopterin-guanine dinucleotide biosynthesis protein A
MGAIHAALTECENEYVFFIPCDMPFITEENIFYLFDTMDTTADAVVFTAKDRIFPTVGIYRKSILPQLEKQIESGNYKMMKLLESIKTQYVQAPFSHQFKNINTPADYDSIK